MKEKVLKVTSVINIIFGLHYLVLAILAIFVAGFSALLSLATFSLASIGGTFGIILAVILLLFLTIIYGMGGIWTIKNDKKKALISMMIAAVVGLISILVAMIHPTIKVSFIDVLALVLPVIHGYLIIQTD